MGGCEVEEDSTCSVSRFCRELREVEVVGYILGVPEGKSHSTSGSSIARNFWSSANLAKVPHKRGIKAATTGLS